MLKDDCCHHILKLRGISLHWKLLLSDVNKLIYIYIFFFCSFALKKSEQTKIVAFNRLADYNNLYIFLFYWRGDQITRVDSCSSIAGVSRRRVFFFLERTFRALLSSGPGFFKKNKNSSV